ncbi:hypothetical protein PSAR109036_00285 [Psychrobacter arenosus]|uniref:hypothetical protein n=1 Tax=Psychrobacter arenosus TaxID=256326 RepID=UPI001917CB13|nr:hypothetical protein [Psychrobacter arenosus]
MSNFAEENSQSGSQDSLEKSLGQSLEDEANTAAKDKPKSAYETCVLSEAAKVHALIAKAQQEARERALKEE